MPLSIRLDSNIREFERALSDTERKALPTATRNAINDTAFDVRKHTVDVVYPRTFKVRNTRFIGAALRVDKANKTNLTASVFDRLKREYLQRHTTGGVKRPSGRNLAIPAGVKRGAQGGVTKANRPRQILNKKNVFKTNIRGRITQNLSMHC